MLRGTHTATAAATDCSSQFLISSLIFFLLLEKHMCKVFIFHSIMQPIDIVRAVMNKKRKIEKKNNDKNRTAAVLLTVNGEQ